MKISFAILLCVFFHSTFGRHECKARQCVYSTFAFEWSSNRFIFWMISTTPFRINILELHVTNDRPKLVQSIRRRRKKKLDSSFVELYPIQ